MNGADYETIELTIEDPIALIRLNVPDRLNALSFAMTAEIKDAVDRAVADPSVVGIVITGNGRAFSAGGDIGELDQITAQKFVPPLNFTHHLPGYCSYLWETPKPVIAAVNGVAAGGGLVLALTCDVRFADPDSTFVTAFLNRGLAAEYGTPWILPRLIGPGHALDLLWAGEMITAQRALELGIVEHLCPDGEDVVEAARQYIEKLAANASPRSIAESKSMVYRHLGMGFRDALEDSGPLTRGAAEMPDAREGILAFVERRQPRFARITGYTDPAN